MSERSKSAMANIELSRELYSESQRKQFFSEFQTALNAESSTYKALDAHWRNNPTRWKFWKKPSVIWKEEEAKLKAEYIRACLALSQLKKTHPLLVKVFNYKSEPLN